MSNDILTPVGRIVQGHPMELNNVFDKHGNQKLRKDGQPQQQVYVGFAIVKGAETHWNQTEWGAKIHAIGQSSWPKGEWQAPSFAWKIEDGDSTIPNKKGKRNCDQEGMPGHWIIKATNGFAPDCFAHGNYAQQVMRKETFKTGDYARLVISSKGNGSEDSPGVYINLLGCELVQAGQQIVSSSSIDAQATFGSVAAQLPAGAQIDPNLPAAPTAAQPTSPAAPSASPAPSPAQAAPVAAPAGGDTAPPPPPQPAHDFLNYNGNQYTADQLRGWGWSEEQINSLR